jgi:dephospho-CoA kinase
VVQTKFEDLPMTITPPGKNKLGILIGVVGPCGAGKSSLVAALRTLGVISRHIAQEHSYVPDMWKRITNPDVLVFLEVSYENTVLRRKLNWTYEEYAEQLRRLQHALQHADLVINTNLLKPEQVVMAVVSFINNQSLPIEK